jgi:hypothetical protein
MQISVTAAQLADELQITSSRLTRWLRKQHAAGHPLLGARAFGAPWAFSRQDADQLAGLRACRRRSTETGEVHVETGDLARRSSTRLRSVPKIQHPTAALAVL